MSPLSEDERQQYEVTLGTLRDFVERMLTVPAGYRHDHARGYERAMRDVKAILDKHGAPADEPVHLEAR